MAAHRSITFALLSVGLLTIGCSEDPVEPPEVIQPIKIHTIGSMDMEAYRDYPGSVKAFQEARMGFEVSKFETAFEDAIFFRIQYDESLLS